MSQRIADQKHGNTDDDEVTRVEDKSEFIRLAMKLLELKEITDTNEIKNHLQSLLKHDEKPKDS